MITYDEVVTALYLMEITADLVVFETNQKIVHDYITQQQAKDRRLKKIEELLEVYKGIDGGGSPEGLNKLYRLRDDLKKELEEME